MTEEKKTKKDIICCAKCGRDITRSMKIHPHGLVGGAYCYDCGEAEKARIRINYPKTRRRRSKRKG